MHGDTIIRWAGSKRKLVPTLLKHLPSQYDRYVEPFCGSACLFFAQTQSRALLTDFNEDLVNALKQIKKSRTIHEQLTQIPATEKEYYRQRSREGNSLTPEEKAIRFLYLNRYCFNGVYRTNKSGKFNVPRGTRTGGFPTEEIFTAAREKLRQAQIKKADYKTTLKSLEKGDFVYLDPPYSKSGKFTGEYGVGSFNSDNLDELLSLLRELDKKGIKFLFSYRLCEDTVFTLSKDFAVDSLKVNRHISGFKKNWDTADEILVKNYEK